LQSLHTFMTMAKLEIGGLKVLLFV